MNFLKRLWNDEEGQGLVEYGLILLLMVVIAIGVVTIFRPQIEAIFTRISTTIGGDGAAGAIPDTAPGE